MTPAKKRCAKRCSLIFPPLPLARELKVVRKRACGVHFRIETPPVSWLGELSRYIRDPSAAFPSRHRISIDSLAGPVARAEKLPPYSRAAATVFHRLPVRGVSLWLFAALDNSKPRRCEGQGRLCD